MSATELQQRAEQRARCELGLAPNSPFSAAEASVALKYALAERNSTERCAALGAQWDWSNTTDGASVHHALAHCPDYCSRLRELASEANMSQRLAPELCISPQPLPHAQLQALLPGAHNHAVLFASSQLFTHEFYPLAVDAFSCDSGQRGRPFFNVLGIRLDWIDPTGYAQRAIALDTEHNQLLEIPLERALPIHSAHFLSLGNDECALHEEWSTRLAIPQINPTTAAALADDKCATAQIWVDAGLPVPPFTSVGPCDTETAASFIKDHGQVVIKPNADSEGRGVTYLQNTADFAAYWRTNAGKKNALLQARRDRAFFKDPQTQAIHTLALRLNVGFDGIQRKVESGYAQIGSDLRSPASRGRGGAIAALAHIENNIVYQSEGNWRPLDLDKDFWRTATDRAERGAAIFVDLLFAGLDIIIDVCGDGRPKALLLEANPRPAGLCHARLLRDGQVRDGQAGVGEAMWNGLYTRLEQPTIAAF